MELWIDRYAGATSPIHRWEPRCRLVGLASLIVACAALDDLVLLPVAILVAASCYLIARLPLSFLFSRLRYPGLFLLIVVLVLPFAPGPTRLAAVGPLTLYQEGSMQAMLVAVRFGCILTLSLVLFGTAPFLATVAAMRALGLPALLGDIMVFFHRYLADTAMMLASRQRAMQLRGFRMRRPGPMQLHSIAALVGSMLVQSYERSERIYQAMRLRGYGQASAQACHARIRSNDWFGLAAAMSLSGVLIGASLLINQGTAL